MKTIYILWIRQIKRYYRSKSRIVGSLAQPLLFLVSLGFGFGPIFQRAGQGNYIEFLAPGVISMSIIFTAIFSGIELIWDRQFGFLKETLVAPVSRLNIMLGRTLVGATVAAGQGLVVFFISLLAGFRPQNWLLLPGIIALMVLVALLFTALGTAVASTMEDMQGFFLSGALFPLNGLPPALVLVAKFNPLSYGVDALRHLMIGAAYFSLGTDIIVLCIVTALFLILGSYLFSKIEV